VNLDNNSKKKKKNIIKIKITIVKKKKKILMLIGSVFTEYVFIQLNKLFTNKYIYKRDSKEISSFLFLFILLF